MLIIGCDFHPGFQQVAIFDNSNGRNPGAAFIAPRGSGAVLWVAARASGAGGDGGLRALSPV